MPFRINQKTQLQYKNSLSFTNDFSVAEDGGEPVEPSEEFRYREIIETVVYFPPFDLQDYPKPFLSYSAELAVELLEAVIEQNKFSVEFNESELYRVYPDKSLQELIDDGDVSVKWFKDSAEVVGETDASLPLDQDNGDQGKSVYSEVTNNVDNSVITSNTITVQKQDWTPSEIETLAWFSAESVVSIGGKVESATDLSDKGRDASQSDSDKRPDLILDALNGKPIIRFDGTDDILSADWQMPIHEVACFVVGRPIGDPITTTLFVAMRPGNSNRFYVDGNTLAKGGSQQSNGGDRELWHQFLNAGTSTQHLYSRDGESTQITSDSSTATTNLLHLGGGNVDGSSNGVNSFGNVEIAEAVFIDSATLSANTDLIQGYLAHKWGLTDKLPSDHPYKTTAP